MPSNTISTLKPMDQGIVLNFNSYFLRKNISVKTVAAIDSDSFDGSKQSKLKTFWKGFTILDVTKKICDSWEEVIISTLTEVWKKFIPILLDDFDRFKTSVEQVTRDVVKIARRGAWRYDWIVATSWHDFNKWGVASYVWAKKVVSWMEKISWWRCVKTTEMTIKDFEYYINLVDKAVAGFERTDSNLEISFTGE